MNLSTIKIKSRALAYHRYIAGHMQIILLKKCHHSLQHGNFLSLITVQLVISKETYTEVVSTSLGITLLSRTLTSCYGVGTMIMLMRARFVSKVDCALSCLTYLIACIPNQNRTMYGLFMCYKNQLPDKEPQLVMHKCLQ